VLPIIIFGPACALRALRSGEASTERGAACGGGRARRCAWQVACARGLSAAARARAQMGKVIGGGLPVGAYGGPREIMELVAPAGARAGLATRA